MATFNKERDPLWTESLANIPSAADTTKAREAKEKSLCRVLNNVISAVLKQHDAPCSASTHINTAIYELLSLCPNYDASNDETREVIADAVLEIGALRNFGKDAVVRAGEMMDTSGNLLHPLAIQYAKHLGAKVGECAEVYLTAFAHYAQAVEGLKCADSAYKIDEAGKKWFEAKIGGVE